MSEEIKKEEAKVTNTEEQPELSDDQLEDVSGGLRYKLKDVLITSYSQSGGEGGASESVDGEDLTVRNIGSSGEDG